MLRQRPFETLSGEANPLRRGRQVDEWPVRQRETRVDGLQVLGAGEEQGKRCHDLDSVSFLLLKPADKCRHATKAR